MSNPNPLLAPAPDSPGAGSRPAQQLAPIQTAPVIAYTGEEMIPDDVRQDMNTRTREFMHVLTTLPHGGPDWKQHVSTIREVGLVEARKSTAEGNALLDEPVRSLADTADSKSPVAQDLVELRSQVRRLDPNQGGPVRRFLASLPGRELLAGWLDKYQSAQAHLDDLTARLGKSAEGLRADNQALRVEQHRLWETMARTAQWVYLVEQITVAVEAKITAAESAGDTELAEALRSEVLYVVTAKHQDLLETAATAKQNFLALELVVSTNEDLRGALEKATTTTLDVLRTTVIAAQAVTRQANVAKQVEGVRDTTSQMMVNTSQMLRENASKGARLRTATAVDVAALKESFANLYAAIEDARATQSGAVEQMNSTIRDLSGLLADSTARLDSTARG